jgi:hypothetical protein
MYRYGWIALLLLAVLLAACGGDDENPNESESQSGEATPTSLFPPTWTPIPTRTEPPRATIDYTYEAPETTPGVFPTRPPVTPGTGTPEQQQQQVQPPLSTPVSSPASALPTSSPTQLVAPLDALNASIREQFNRVAGGFFEAAPEIRFEDEMITAALTVYTTPGNKDTAREVMIEMSASVDAGRVVLTMGDVYFADDQTPYEDALAGYIMGAIETAINDLFRQQYLTVSPSGEEYTITSITMTDTMITAEY